jgi:Tfp pilus assembly protein PilN
MSAVASIDVGCPYESVPNALFGRGSPRHRLRRLGLPCRHHAIECTAAITLGALMAIVGANGGSAEDRAGARRVVLEQQLAQLSPSLAELAWFQRAGESARTGAAVALAQARPYAELRALLDALSRHAHAGVTVSRLRQGRDGFELRVRAVDSAACTSWVERLARMRGWEAADIADLRLVAATTDDQAAGAVEAIVRLPSRAAASASASASTSTSTSTLASRQISPRGGDRGGRSER